MNWHLNRQPIPLHRNESLPTTIYYVDSPMFKRIIYDDWTHIIPLVSFWLTFGVFLGITVRALLINKATVRHMEQLPLKPDARSTTDAAKQ